MTEEKPRKLEAVEIPVPCPMIWGEMDGDERKRFCQQCDKHVHNLSDMPRVEAERLLENNKGELCVSFFRNEDGTVRTDECPRMLRPLRSAWIQAASVCTGIMMAVSTFVPALAKDPPAPARNKLGRPVMPERLLGEALAPSTAKPAPQPTAGMPAQKPTADTPAAQPLTGKPMMHPQPLTGSPVPWNGPSPTKPPVSGTDGGVIHCAAFAENIVLKERRARLENASKGEGTQPVLIGPELSIKYSNRPAKPIADSHRVWQNWCNLLEQKAQEYWSKRASHGGLPHTPVKALVSIHPGGKVILESSKYSTFHGDTKGTPEVTGAMALKLNRCLGQLSGIPATAFPLSDVEEVKLTLWFNERMETH